MRLANNLDRHKITKEFNFRPDRTIDFSYLPFREKSAEQNVFNAVRNIVCLVLTETL